MSGEQAEEADSEVEIGLSLSSLTFSGGQRVDLADDTILVLVGPNNAGKSRALKEIISHIDGQPGQVITSLEKKTTGTHTDLLNWIHARFAQNGRRGGYKGIGGVIDLEDIREWPKTSRQIIDNLCILATAEKRFELLGKVAPINPITDPETHPLHFLLTYKRAEERLGTLVKRSFGVDVILNRGSGDRMQLHCGARPQHPDRVSFEYLRELHRLPTLNDQGDGLRSFYACLVQILLGEWKLVLVDEPEVFLHPPQAEQLGEILAQQTPPGRQLVVATHSTDLLRGMLKHAASRIKLVRIVRDGDINNVSELAPEGVVSLWNDPYLRFTNALDSLFHESVIVCEAESDCHFYEALLATAKPDATRPMFSPAGGKQALKKLVKALRSLGVPCSAVADFDLLNDKQVLQGLWEAAGGTWSEIEQLWQRVRAGVETDSTVPHRGKVLEEIRSLLVGPSSERLLDKEADKIREIVRNASGWAKAKSAGLNALPQGAVYDAGAQLLGILRSRNVHVVPVGEMERFAPSISGKSGPWATAVLAAYDLTNEPTLSKAREFAAALPPKVMHESPQQVNAEVGAEKRFSKRPRIEFVERKSFLSKREFAGILVWVVVVSVAMNVLIRILSKI